MNATESGFTIECTEGPWNGGVAQSQVSFVAEVFNIDTQEYVTNVTVEGSPVFLFKELPNAENNDAGYRVQINALNHKGRSSITLITAHVLNASKYTRKRIGKQFVVCDSINSGRREVGAAVITPTEPSSLSILCFCRATAANGDPPRNWNHFGPYHNNSICGILCLHPSQVQEVSSSEQR